VFAIHAEYFLHRFLARFSCSAHFTFEHTHFLL
jgi:hypothetical protein